MKPRVLWTTCFVCAVLSFSVVEASAGVVDFETLGDSVTVTNQFSGLGLTFKNATALKAGISLDEAEFPPHSGVTVVADLAGPIVIDFAAPVSSVGGFFTYATGLTLRAFDSSATLIDTVTSAFSANFVSSGNPPNEFLQVGSALGIAELTITGDPAGGSFVLDDLTFAGTTHSAPEPASLALLGLGLAGLGLMRRRRAG